MKAPVKIERSDLAWSGEDTANRDREEEEQAGSNVGQDVRRLKLKSGKQRCSLPMNRSQSQSGIGLPHSTTLARNSGVPLGPRGRGVRQPYAALTSVHWQADNSAFDQVRLLTSAATSWLRFPAALCRHSPKTAQPFEWPDRWSLVRE